MPSKKGVLPQVKETVKGNGYVSSIERKELKRKMERNKKTVDSKISKARKEKEIEQQCNCAQFTCGVEVKKEEAVYEVVDEKAIDEQTQKAIAKEFLAK